MEYIYVCNTGSHDVSQVCLGTLMEERIKLNNVDDENVGPHGICVYKENLLIANSYDNTLCKINCATDSIESYYIGAHCTDVAVQEDSAFIACGEGNCIIVFDLKENKVISEMPCGVFPHNIEILNSTKIGLVANMLNDSIYMFNCESKDMVKNIRVGAYPTKAIFLNSSKEILVCESHLGEDKEGSISIYSTENCKLIKRAKVGFAPVDMCLDNSLGIVAVSNFQEGTISLIDISTLKELKRIPIGGMPRGILQKNRALYVGDNYLNELKIIDIITNKIKVIPLGKEPNGMTFY